MWKVGQKVVCVNGEFPFEIKAAAAAFGMKLPKKGEKYHIRAISDGQGGVAFLLEEIVNPHLKWLSGHGELHFIESRFRALPEASKESEEFAEQVIKDLEQFIESQESVAILKQ